MKPVLIAAALATSLAAFAAEPTFQTSFHCSSKEASVEGVYEHSAGKITFQPVVVLKTQGQSIVFAATDYSEINASHRVLGRAVAFDDGDWSGVLTTHDFGDNDYASSKPDASLVLFTPAGKRVHALACGFSTTEK